MPFIPIYFYTSYIYTVFMCSNVLYTYIYIFTYIYIMQVLGLCNGREHSSYLDVGPKG